MGLARQRAFRLEKVIQKPSSQFSFYILIILLAGIGLAFQFSASYYFSKAVGGSPYKMVIRQGLWVLLGSIFIFVISRFSVDTVKKGIIPLLIVTLVLNLMTYLPVIGIKAGGAQRWIGLTIGGMSLSFQPSELIKISLTLYLVRMFDKNRERMDDFFHVVLPPLVVVLLFVGLIFLQNDFSTAMYVFVFSYALFFLAGVRKRYLLLVGAVFAGLAVLMVAFEPYRLERIVAWFSPEKDPLSSGYQILRSREALKAGGFWGVGAGCGLSKQGGLPQSYSDFIASVIGEETGLAGLLFTLGLFVSVLVKGIQTFLYHNSWFNRYASLALAFSVFLQALVNLGVASGLFPATGIPLPLFSSGGSAAFTTMAVFGLLILLGRGEEKTRQRRSVK